MITGYINVNEYTHKTLAEYVPRCEKTCAVCAVKDWIEDLAEVYGDTPR